MSNQALVLGMFLNKEFEKAKAEKQYHVSSVYGTLLMTACRVRLTWAAHNVNAQLKLKSVTTLGPKFTSVAEQSAAPSLPEPVHKMWLTDTQSMSLILALKCTSIASY